MTPLDPDPLTVVVDDVEPPSRWPCLAGCLAMLLSAALMLTILAALVSVVWT